MDEKKKKQTNKKNQSLVPPLMKPNPKQQARMEEILKEHDVPRISNSLEPCPHCGSKMNIMSLYVQPEDRIIYGFRCAKFSQGLCVYIIKPCFVDIRVAAALYNTRTSIQKKIIPVSNLVLPPNVDRN